MKNKTKGIILGLIVAISLVAMFLNQPIKTKKEIRYNETHKEEDVHMIMETPSKVIRTIIQKSIACIMTRIKAKKWKLSMSKKAVIEK